MQFRKLSYSIFGYFLCGLLASAATAFAAENSAPEYRLKAAYVYNFIKFVTWPSERFTEHSNIEVCVLGESPFGDELNFMRSKKIQGRSIHITWHDSLIHAPICDLLFISRSEAPVIAATLRELHLQPVLTVSDIDGFAAEGGMIGISTRADRIALEINLEQAKAAKLDISSKLLELATVESSARKSGRNP